MNRKTTVAVLAVASMALAGCATLSTAPDMVGVQYSGGATQSQSFKKCVNPSTRDWGGISDAYYQYPASQRYWSFDSAGGDTGPITFVTADGIEMSVTGVVNFNLNTDCETLRQFHEKIGNRNQAYFTDENTPAGWSKTLALYVGGPLNTAVDRAGQKYKYTDLYNDTATKTAWENEVLELLPGLVDRQTDGDEQFFQNFSITLQKPEPPASIKEALVEQQAAVARADAAKAEADARVAAAEAQVAVEKAEAEKAKPWVELLGEDGYIEKLMTEKGLNPRQPGGNILNQTQP